MSRLRAAIASIGTVLIVAVVLSGCQLPIPRPDQVSTVTPAPAPSGSGATSVAGQTCSEEETYRRVRPSVVLVVSDLGGSRVSTGTGYALEPDGVILTNEHVVRGTSRLIVVPAGGKPAPARVVRTDARRDLAMIEAPGTSLPRLKMGGEVDVTTGRRVLAIGFPHSDRLEGEPSLTGGIVSALREIEGIQRVQTDAAVNPGNSGGPLLSLCGEVVGTVVSRLRDSEGLNFAIGLREMRAFLAGETPPPQVRSGSPSPSPRPSATPVRSSPTPVRASPSPSSSPGRGSPSPSSTPFRLFPSPSLTPFRLFPSTSASPLAPTFPPIVIPTFGPIPTFRPFSTSTLPPFATRSATISSAETPEDVVLRFYFLLDDWRFNDAYALLSPRFQQREPFVAWRDGYEFTIEIDVERVRLLRPPATVEIQFVATERAVRGFIDQRYFCEYQLVTFGASWLIDSGSCREVP